MKCLDQCQDGGTMPRIFSLFELAVPEFQTFESNKWNSTTLVDVQKGFFMPVWIAINQWYFSFWYLVYIKKHSRNGVWEPNAYFFKRASCDSNDQSCLFPHPILTIIFKVPIQISKIAIHICIYVCFCFFFSNFCCGFPSRIAATRWWFVFRSFFFFYELFFRNFSGFVFLVFWGHIRIGIFLSVDAKGARCRDKKERCFF